MRPLLVSVLQIPHAPKRRRQITDAVREERNGIVGFDTRGDIWWLVLRVTKDYNAKIFNTEPIRWEHDNHTLEFCEITESSAVATVDVLEEKESNGNG